MDFDPSEFLAMAMSEDQDSVYTAPDFPEPEISMQMPPGTIIVEGGLQMEKDMKIPVPTFNTLDLHNQEEVVENGYGIGPLNIGNAVPVTNIDEPIYVDSPEPNNTTPQPSPIERTASPQTIKKIIPTTYGESRFRKDLFYGIFERVKLFRLHCTICNKHLGCAPWFTERQMRTHKLLNVVVCRQCFEFYGDVNFPVEDGSEIYCCWCGQGGEVFCCSTCPKVVCKKCIIRNFGTCKLQEIEENDNWACIVCKPSDIWPHRAILYGLQRYARELRLSCSMLSKDEKQVQLSKDMSHCCPKVGAQFPPISLPSKQLMSKIPFCLIAVTHQESVKNQPDKQNLTNFHTNVARTSTGTPPVVPTHHLNNNLLQAATSTSRVESLATPIAGISTPRVGPVSTSHVEPHSTPSIVPSLQQNLRMRLQSPPQSSISTFQMNHHMSYKGAITRPAPYPVNRKVAVHSRLPYTQNNTCYRNVVPVYPSHAPQPSNHKPPTPNRPSLHLTEVIDLVEDKPTNNTSNSIVTNHDISWLVKGINDVEEILSPIQAMIGQIGLISNDLRTDFSKLTTFSDRLTYNIKIAICNLAKINQDITDAKKVSLDSKVTSVVNDIHMNGISSPVSINRVLPTSNSPRVIDSQKVTSIVRSSTPQKEPEHVTPQDSEQITSSPPATGEEDVGDLAAALLCEAVLEVEGNKENENANKAKRSPTKKSKPQNRSRPLSKKGSRNASLNNQKYHTKIQVIDLSDEDGDDTFDADYYCKKFNIKPCKVVLKRCKIPRRRR